MQHNYDLNERDERAAKVGWKYTPFKTVILTNVKIAQNRITVDKVAKHLKGRLLLPEWERKQAYWLVKAIVEAIEKGEKTADISQMFSCDFFAKDGDGVFSLPQYSIQNELMYALFSIDYETDEELALKLKWKVIL